MQIHNAIITGSFSYNGADLSNVTSSNAYSASLSSRTTDLESTSSVLVGASSSFSSILSSVSSSQQQISSSFLTLTASFNAVSASQQQISSSLLQVSASYISLSGSYNTFSGSASTRTTQIENVYATTGSNSFRANQSITGSLVVSSTITAQTLVVQTVTSSIIYSSGSNVFGCDLNSRQTFTGSVLMTGSLNVFGNISSSGNLRIDKDQADIQLNITCATQYSRVLFSQGASVNGGVQLIGPEYTGARKCRLEIFGSGISLIANGVFESPGMFITGSNVGIGTITPTYTLDVNGTGGFCGNINISRNANTLTRLITSNTTAGTSAYVETTFISDTSSGASAIGKYSSATSAYKIITASNTFLYNNTVAGDIAILNDFASGAIKMAAGGSSTSHFTIASTGAATFTCQVNAESFYTNDTRYISNQIMAGYNTNSEDSDIWINYTGYQGGTTRFRDFRVGNGKQGQIAVFDGSTSAATFSGTVNVYDGSSHGLSISNSSGAITFTNNWSKTTFTVGSAQDIEFNDDAGVKRLFLSTGGSVGIGTVSPSAKLDIAQMGGDNTRTCNALYLRAGNNSDVFNSNQILFGYNCGTQYAHAIKTRHNSNNSIDNAIDFYTWKYGDAADTKAGQYVMTIAGNGRIGIGTCQPQFTIDLSLDDTTRAIQFYGGTGTDKYGIGKFGGSGATTVFHGGAGASNRVSLGCYNGTTYTPNFEVLGNGVICMINIGSGAGTYALKWNSSTKNVTYDTSSERYKDNIRNSTYGLCHILQLNSRMFEYKDQCRTDIGFIAEELYPIIPELVMLDENLSPNGVSYDRMVSVLVEGMKEQQCTINTLKTCLGIN